MTARVLVVDDLLANVRLLEAKLTAEYFEVDTAMNGVDALATVQRTRPDIVLLDVMMPGMDGIEVCQRIKSNPQTSHIPVVMVTALDQPEDRVRGLEAGADDFLTKPINDLALFCRVKSLARLKMLTDELRARCESGDDGLLTAKALEKLKVVEDGKILVVDDRDTLFERINASLGEHHNLSLTKDPQQALFDAAENEYELVIINLDLEGFDGLRLCSQLRTLERTRQTPILIIVDPDDNARKLRALEMGVNDYLSRPIDKQELAVRVDTQIRRWRYTQILRNNVQQSLELAVTDPLTNLFNRRYMQNQMEVLVDNACNRGKALSVLTLDIDFFKRINDTYGHDAGDKVLVELSKRIRQNIRSVDLACRTGGEEFAIVLPETELRVAGTIAERIRRAIFSKPFKLEDSEKSLNITASIGVACLEGPNDTPEKILKRADVALYKAKEEGRNRVIANAA